MSATFILHARSALTFVAYCNYCHGNKSFLFCALVCRAAIKVKWVKHTELLITQITQHNAIVLPLPAEWHHDILQHKLVKPEVHFAER